jgi:phage gpG-like protein
MPVAPSKAIQVVVKPTLEELRKRLDKKRRAVMDLRTPYARASVLLDQWVQKNFKTEGGKVGGWVPFAKNSAGVPYVELREPDRTPAELLQRIGRLRSSFTPFASKSHAGIGSDLPYAKTHHEGLGNAPERQLLPDHNPAYREVMRSAREIMAEYNDKALKK